MAFNRSWNENDPDGDVITISLLDDSQRDIKVAVRERLEGDSSDPYSGIFENGSFANSARIRQGTARAHVTTDANIASLPKIDGAIGISSDGKRLYHLASAGAVELEYLNRDGSRPATADIDLGNHHVKNLQPATAAGHAVEYNQAALVDQQRTITNLWTFNRGTSAPFAVPSGSAKVANLDVDKLDGHHSSEFLLADALPPQNAVAKYAVNAIAFGTSYTDITNLTVTLNQSGAWIFRYFIYMSIAGSFKARTSGATLSILQWSKGDPSGNFGAGTEVTSAESGPIIINALISGNAGVEVKFQLLGVSNSGTILQGSSLIAVKV